MSERATFAEAVRGAVERHPTVDPWTPGASCDDRNPALHAALAELGWHELGSDDELERFIAPAAVELGRGLAPLCEVDALLGGSPVADGLVRYAAPGDVLGDGSTLVRAERRAYTDAVGACVVLEARPGPPRAEAPWVAASLGYLAGLCAFALGVAARHTLDREQFGRPLAALEPVQQHLAGAATLTDGLLLLAEEPATWAGLAHAAEAACSVTGRCQQVTGATGYTLEFPLQRAHRRARSCRAWIDAMLERR